jgi:glycosyltransferase involved in cell wall biosynthesis
MKISIITATYNCAATLGDALDSVAAQQYGNIEHVLVDGASTDGTLALLESRRGPLSSLVSEPDKGIYDALNKGIARATGEVIGFLHADDIYADELVLQRIADAFADPAVSAVYGDLQYVRKQDTDSVVRHWRSGVYSRSKLGWGWMPPHPALYVRREWYDRIGGFDTRYRIAADYDSILKLFSQPDFKAAYIPEVLVKMRVGGASNRSLKNILQKSREDYSALKLSGVGGAGALLWKNLGKLGQFFAR